MHQVYKGLSDIAKYTDLMHCGIAKRAKCIPQCIINLAFFKPTMHHICEIMLFVINLILYNE